MKNYENQIIDILLDLYYEDWMDEEYWYNFLCDINSDKETSFENLSIDIEMSILDGNSLENSLVGIKEIFKDDKYKKMLTKI